MRPTLRRALPLSLLAAMVCAWSASAGPGLLSKRYEFKAGVVLEIGADTAKGARLDTVRFQLPRPVDGRHERAGGLVKAEVTVSNTAATPLHVGIAIALHDDDRRLLGVASASTGLVAIKPGRQKSFDLVFDDVNAAAHRTTSFQISVEPK